MFHVIELELQHVIKNSSLVNYVVQEKNKCNNFIHGNIALPFYSQSLLFNEEWIVQKKMNRYLKQEQSY